MYFIVFSTILLFSFSIIFYAVEFYYSLALSLELHLV